MNGSKMNKTKQWCQLASQYKDPSSYVHLIELNVAVVIAPLRVLRISNATRFCRPMPSAGQSVV